MEECCLQIALEVGTKGGFSLDDTDFYNFPKL